MISSLPTSLSLQQQGARLEGIHHGDFLPRDLSGAMNGDRVHFRSSLPEREVGNALTYTFTGTVAGETMSGDLDLGETSRRNGVPGNISTRGNSAAAKFVVGCYKYTLS